MYSLRAEALTYMEIKWLGIGSTLLMISKNYIL